MAGNFSKPERQRDRETERQRDRQTDRQRDKQRDRQTNKKSISQGNASQRALAQVRELTCYKQPPPPCERGWGG